MGSALLGVLSGCGAGGGTLPSTVLVELPDGTTVEVEQGDGVASLANSTWEFFQTTNNAQGPAFLTISFGPNGNLERFENNTISPEIFGDTILFDGARHATNQAGLTYEATTYGAQTEDGSGFAFEGRLTAFVAGFTAATVNADASGTFDPDEADVMTGMFEISSRSSLSGFEQYNSDASISFLARRVE